METQASSHGYSGGSQTGAVLGTPKENTSDQFAAELHRMTDLIDRLESRLTNVLEPLGPETMAKVPTHEATLVSPLRDRIYFLGELNSRLNSLCERIDL